MNFGTGFLLQDFPSWLDVGILFEPFPLLTDTSEISMTPCQFQLVHLVYEFSEILFCFQQVCSILKNNLMESLRNGVKIIYKRTSLYATDRELKSCGFVH